MARFSTHYILSVAVTANLILIACGMRPIQEPEVPDVAVYMSAEAGVLDLHWDRSPQNLVEQLRHLGFAVNVATNGQPNLDGPKGPKVYIIPTQNGSSFYSASEDMTAVTKFVDNGGLVLMLDANNGDGEAHKHFIAKALDYSGDWSSCNVAMKTSELREEINLHELAKSFLPLATWPLQLETAHEMTVINRCHHRDPMAVSWPLYHIKGSLQNLVAQAFGKFGKRGSVVWLGYSWKDGIMPGWGSLLKTLTEQFRNGAFVDPSGVDSDLQLTDNDFLDQVVKEVTNVGDVTDEMVRRFLQIASPAVYPPPPSTPPPDTPPPEQLRFVGFKKLLGMGVYLSEAPKPVLWFDDQDFRSYRKPRSYINVIFWNNANPCNVTVGTCTQCPRAWQADTTNNVTILFREPWQLDTIFIRQLQNPGVLRVELLPWPAVPIPGLNITPAARPLSPPIWNAMTDNTRCGGTLRIPLRERSGTGLRVPRRGSQEDIPASLRSTTFGGVNIILKPQPSNGRNALGYTFIESVRFDGRALFPKDPEVYAPDHA